MVLGASSSVSEAARSVLERLTIKMKQHQCILQQQHASILVRTSIYKLVVDPLKPCAYVFGFNPKRFATHVEDRLQWPSLAIALRGGSSQGRGTFCPSL
jgi:hypothetical protein